jgi:hypothetical protein
VTVADVQRLVEAIRERAGDDERAHSQEDDLHQEVLKQVAEGAPEPWCSLAREALRTKDIDFARWCA